MWLSYQLMTEWIVFQRTKVVQHCLIFRVQFQYSNRHRQDAQVTEDVHVFDHHILGLVVSVNT